MMRSSVLLRLLFLLALHQTQSGWLVSAAFIRQLRPRKESEGANNEAAEAAAATAAAIIVTDKTLLEKVPYLAVASLVGLGMDSLVEKFFNATRLMHEKGDYKKTLVFGVLESIDFGAKAYGLTLFVDFLQSILPKLKQISPFQTDLFQVAPSIGMVVWAASSLSSIKRLLLHKAVYGTRLGKVAFIDRLMDLSLGLGTVYNVLHRLKVDIGMGLNSLFAASGVSAIVFSLASKGMVEQMVGGLLLQAWDAIEVGEYVRLGDGTEGTVVRIGLIETEILGADHVPMRVPNSQIVGKRISMFSKVTKSQVKQTLRFKYSDLEKLPTVLRAIQQGIETKCADDPMDKPPQVVLTQYEADHIQVSVSCSFNIKPGSPEFVTVREKVLFAIADAVQAQKVDFAIPAIQYETAASGSESQHPVKILGS